MRDEFLAWLARLVADGIITEDEAAQMLAEFDRGERQWDAPLPLSTAILGGDRIDEAALLAVLAALLGGRHFPGVTASHANLQMVNGVQTVFEREAYRLAAELTGGRMSLAQWQRAMLRALQTQAGAAVALARKVRGVAATARLDNVLILQSAYLSRFADTLALKLQSQGLIASRSALYGNAIRSLYYEEQEETASEALGDGWVVVWHSQDDRHTCPLCIERDGAAWLSGSAHPVPGQPGLCFGRCRCWLEYAYDPLRWQALRDGVGGGRRRFAMGRVRR
jgi:hypothetical protein